MGHVLHVEHGDELAQVLRHQGGGRAQGVDHDRHARDLVGFAVPDGEAVDVEGPPPEEAGHAVEDAGLVEDARHQRVLHAVTPSSAAGRRIIACRSAPAGTIGYTASSFSTRKSMRAGWPEPRTACTVEPTSARVDTRWPAMP